MRHFFRATSFLPSFPIDAVYLWVDGNDPEWLAKKQQAMAALTGTSAAPPSAATAAARFRDNGELRYSLRSLAAFAPWIRRTFIITDGQCPPWLHTDAATLVHHREIFPPDAAYPVFSNRPIEWCMHRIPGLAEHFISFNDDFMLGRAVTPLDFFTPEGLPLVWYAKRGAAFLERRHTPIRPGMNPHTSATNLAHQMIFQHYGRKFPCQMKHYPRAMTRTSVEDLSRIFPDVVTRTLQSSFRSHGDMSPFPLYSLYLLATGAGKGRRINGMQGVRDLCRRRYAYAGASLGDANVAGKLALIRAIHPQTFCINDAEGAGEQCRAALQRFLAEYFPEPSRYER